MQDRLQVSRFEAERNALRPRMVATAARPCLSFVAAMRVYAKLSMFSAKKDPRVRGLLIDLINLASHKLSRSISIIPRLYSIEFQAGSVCWWRGIYLCRRLGGDD